MIDPLHGEAPLALMKEALGRTNSYTNSEVTHFAIWPRTSPRRSSGR
jgi:hypothetical protein